MECCRHDPAAIATILSNLSILWAAQSAEQYRQTMPAKRVNHLTQKAFWHLVSHPIMFWHVI
jgi:hypothetical protein